MRAISLPVKKKKKKPRCYKNNHTNLQMSKDFKNYHNNNNNNN